MNNRTDKYNNELVTYISRTFKNKICALTLIGLATIYAIVEHDSTFLVFTLIGGVPLFLTRKRVIY